MRASRLSTAIAPCSFGVETAMSRWKLAGPRMHGSILEGEGGIHGCFARQGLRVWRLRVLCAYSVHGCTSPPAARPNRQAGHNFHPGSQDIIFEDDIPRAFCVYA